MEQNGGVSQSPQDSLTLNLPSEKYRPGDVWPEGFVLHPDNEHRAKSAQALSELGDRLSFSAPGRTLRVCLTHFRHKQLLAHNLHGFFVRDFDEAGNPVDPFGEGLEIRFGLVINFSLELQRDTTLAFLNQLAFRQRRLGQLEANQGDISQIDLETARLDRKALTEVADRSRYGWESACDAVLRNFRETGFSLQVRYEPDPIPLRAQVVRRMPFLRRIYNEFDSVRDAIDRIVSLIGGSEPRLVAHGMPSEIRDRLQQQTALLGVQRYINQAVRDSLVVGNGYLAFRREEPHSPFNLRPDETVLGDSGFMLQLPSGAHDVDDHVTHIRGIEQTESLYGISLLEVFIESLQQLDVSRGAQSDAENILSHPQASEEAQEHANRLVQLANRMQSSVEERIRALLFLPERLPVAKSRLYFPGQERL